MGIETGTMNQRITIQKRAVTVNENGFQTKAWTEFYSCWAYVNGLSGSEYWAAHAVQAEETVVFMIRYCRVVKEMDTRDFRIMYSGKPYDIKSIDNVRHENDMVKIRAIAHSMEVASDEV